MSVDFVIYGFFAVGFDYWNEIVIIFFFKCVFALSADHNGGLMTVNAH